MKLKYTSYFSSIAMIIGGNTRIGAGKITRENAVCDTAYKTKHIENYTSLI